MVKKSAETQIFMKIEEEYRYIQFFKVTQQSKTTVSKMPHSALLYLPSATFTETPQQCPNQISQFVIVFVFVLVIFDI